MSFDFTVKEFILGNGTGTPTFQFYRRGFNLGGSGSGPEWGDIILHGNTALSLVNSKADGLNYLKLFGGTEQRNLPSEYTQVEYLEIETEGVYFPTGINATIDTDMGITASNITSNSAQILVAECESGSDYFRIAKAGASQRIISSFGSSTVTDNNTNGVDKFTARMNKSGFYVNGSLVGTFSDIPSSLTDIGKVDIFRGKYSNTTYFAYAGSRFYDAFVNDNIFLPCRRNSDNQLGIYNTKTGQFILPSGTGSFTAGADVTIPSPDTPMDIISNNGVLKWSSNLVNMVSDNIAVGKYISAQGQVLDSTQNFIYSAFIPVKPNTTYTLGLSSAVFFMSISEYSSASDSGFIQRNQFSSGTSVPYIVTSGTITTTANTNYIRFGSNMYSTDLTLEDVLAVDWMLTKTATAQTYIPYGIYTDGTTETVEVMGKNLFNPATTIANGFINASGEVQSSDVLEYSALIPVVAGQTYTWSGTNNSSRTTSKRLHGYDGNGNWVEQLNVVTVTNTSYVNTVTIPNGVAFVRLSGIRIDTPDTSVQFELGLTATTYEAYYNGGSATAEMLLKVGGYQDIQSVLDGAVTRNVGIKVLDGTETITKQTNASAPLGYYFGVESSNINHIANTQLAKSSHFVAVPNNAGALIDGSMAFASSTKKIWIATSLATTEVDFKQWLSDQYNSGNPVVIIYPLATSTTETVTGQPLTIQAGTNIVEITQASIDNLELEVSYKGTV